LEVNGGKWCWGRVGRVGCSMVMGGVQGCICKKERSHVIEDKIDGDENDIDDDCP